LSRDHRYEHDGGEEQRGDLHQFHRSTRHWNSPIYASAKRGYAKSRETVMTLERIEITPFAVIVGDILQNRLTGYLTIVKSPMRKVLYWSQGELVLVTSTSPDDSLADFLVRRGVVTPEKAVQISSTDPTEVVAKFHEAGFLKF